MGFVVPKKLKNGPWKLQRPIPSKLCSKPWQKFTTPGALHSLAFGSLSALATTALTVNIASQPSSAKMYTISMEASVSVEHKISRLFSSKIFSDVLNGKKTAKKPVGKI